jgi:undecaprenyl diphosphate synthase
LEDEDDTDMNANSLLWHKMANQACQAANSSSSGSLMFPHDDDDDDDIVNNNDVWWWLLPISQRELLFVLLGVGMGLWYKNAQWKLNSFTLPLAGYFTGPILRLLGLLVKIRVTPPPPKGVSMPLLPGDVLSMSMTKEDPKYSCRRDDNALVYNSKGEVLGKNYADTHREANVDPHHVPKHVAFIMDGNRRYGKRKYGQGLMGHWEGGQKAIQVIEWCDTEGVDFITLYAFSTENWNRTPEEVAYLMDIFLGVVENDLRPIIFHRKLRFKHIHSDSERIPAKLLAAIDALRKETEPFEGNTTVNVCLSYGSRGEITNTFRNLATDCVHQILQPCDITEEMISQRLATSPCPDPDILIRTSGEERLSNFMLWQLAYAEFFFLKQDWPELTKQDLLEIFRTYAKGRQRRFGK